MSDEVLYIETEDNVVLKHSKLVLVKNNSEWPECREESWPIGWKLDIMNWIICSFCYFVLVLFPETLILFSCLASRRLIVDCVEFDQ